MNSHLKIFFFSIVILFMLPRNILSQDVNIIPYLKKIESGRESEVREALSDLKDDYPNSPSVMFLEGVLTENGQQAVSIYQKIVDQYPKSKYADAALYRIYSYYYALGLYESANNKLKQLIELYPDSPYIKIAKQNHLPEKPVIKSEENKTDSTHNSVIVDDQKQENFKYTIQAGAFSNRENAETLLNKFTNSGIYSNIKEKQVAGTTFHVVYAGKFLNENDALSFLQTIKDKFNINGRVVDINK